MCRKRSPFFENPSSLNTVCRLPLNHSHLSLAAPRPDPRRPQRVPRHEKSRAWCLKHSLEMPQVRGRDFWWQVTVLWTQVTGNMMDNHKVSVYLCSMYVSISDYKTSLLVRSLEVSIPLNLSSVYTRRDIAARWTLKMGYKEINQFVNRVVVYTARYGAMSRGVIMTRRQKCSLRTFYRAAQRHRPKSYRVLHTLDVTADNSLTGDFRLARPHWNNMARLICNAKFHNPLQMYGWVICFEINCTWEQMSHKVMFANRCWSEI